MTKVRKHIMLEDTSKDGLSWEWLADYMKGNGIRTLGDGLQHLFMEYRQLQRQVADQENLAKAIAKEVKPQLDPIRIRTGYVDKNVRVLTNLLNSYLIISGMEDAIPVTDVMAESITATQKQVADQENLAKAIAKEVKPQLDPIRIRTGYVDKNVRVLTNLLNSYLIISGMEDAIPVTDVMAESITATQKQVADQIHAYQVARKDKLTRSTRGDEDE